jgi:hypothetical protein
MADALDILRRDAFRKRVHGAAGGNRILWGEKDLINIHNHVMSVKMEQIIAPPRPTETKLLSAPDIDHAALAKIGIELRSGFGPEDNALVAISTPRTDLADDDVDTSNIDCTDFSKFCQVLDTHDSSKPPVALSSKPWLSGTTLLAIARFPKPGVSEDSDRVAAAVRAGLQRGASIGFVPLKWKFSQDPSRPLGISFGSIKLIEWSFCAIPCNQDCRVIGPISGTTSSPGDTKMADRRRAARMLAAEARALIASIPDPLPLTRQQRIAEAQAFRRLAAVSGK